MDWRTDIENAPRGHFEEVPVGNKGGVKSVHVPDKILAVTSDMKVTVSHWIEKSGRWCMFSKDHPPSHWAPFPEPPKDGE